MTRLGAPKHPKATISKYFQHFDEVSNVSFDDYDLDMTDLGGNLTWVLADDEASCTCAL